MLKTCRNSMVLLSCSGQFSSVWQARKASLAPAIWEFPSMAHRDR